MAAANPQQLIAQNAQARFLLASTSPRISKILGTFVNSPGGITRVKLDNVGITTGLRLDVSCGVTIGVATAVASARAPYNLIQRVRVTDIDQTDRVNLSGFQLFVLQCVRNRTGFGLNQGAVPVAINNPVVPTAVGNGTIQFMLDVPLAFDCDNPDKTKVDYRGSLLQQVAVGEAYLTIEWNSLLYANNNVEAVYSGAGTTTVVSNPATNNIQVTVQQQGIFPQPLGGQPPPLPVLDLMTVYELNGMVRTADNIAVGQEKLISVPSQREVIGLYANYIQGGVQVAGALSRFRLYVNGNNALFDDTERLQLFYQRLYMWNHSDVSPGTYFRAFRDRPIQTALLGNFQWGITPTTVGANAQFETLVESFYTKGSMLPGVQQAS